MKFKSDIEVQAGLRDGSDDIGTAGQILSSTGSQTNWIDQDSIVASEAKLVVIECKNTSGSTISKGTPVYQTGTVGATDVIEIDVADASDEDKMAAIGLLQTDLANNAFGKVVITGELLNITTSPIDGVTPVTGDTIYVKSGGGLTLTKPTGVNFIQNIGLVGKVSGGNSGSITVSSIMRSNDVPTPLYIDHDNQRLGIIEDNPTQTLHVGDGVIDAVTRTVHSDGSYTDIHGYGIIMSRSASYIKPVGNDTQTLYLGDANAGNTWNAVYTNARTNVWGNDANEFMRLTSSGNLGIGTTSPSRNLHVHADSGNAYLQLTQAATGTTSNDGFQISMGAAQVNFINRENGNMVFETNNTEKMRITNTGNVGIGTPTPGSVLDVQGTQGQLFSVTDDLSGEIFAVSDISGVPIMTVNSSGVSYFDGNVGVGTTSPSYKLHVNGGDAQIANGSTATLYMNNSANYLYGDVNGVGIVAAGNNFRVKTNNSERLRIIQNGNVGIGTTSPDGKLDVTDGNAQILLTSASSDRSWLQLKHNAVPVDGEEVGLLDFRGYNDASQDTRYVILTAKAEDVTDGSEDGSLTFQTMKDGTATQVMTLRSGNVGIGTTSPTHLLNLSEDSTNSVQLVIDNTNTTDAGTETSEIRFRHYRSYVAGQNDAGEIIVGKEQAWDAAGDRNSYMAFGTRKGSDAVVEKMRIDSLGNVGIGTTSPLGRLQVNEYTVASQGNQNVHGELSVFANSGDESLFLGIKDAAYPNRGWAFNPIISGVNCNLQFKEHGATSVRMTIESGGNVGIGTTDPTEKLHVDSIGTNYVARFRHSTGSGYAPGSILLEAGQSVSRGQGVYHYNNEADENWFTGVPYNVDSKKWIVANKYSTIQSVDTAQLTHALMTIDSDTGNVGINTTSPDFKLDVDGTFGVSDLPFNTDSVSVLVADETLGADLITNGDFATDTDWTLGTGWSIANGKLTANNPTSYAQQGGVFASGVSNTYKISLTVSNYVSGYFTILTGGSTAQSQQFSANGNYTITFNTNSPSSTTFHFTHFGSFNGSIENVSVQLVTSASNQIQKRELGTGAFGPTPVGAYLPLAGGTMTGTTRHGDNVTSYWGDGDDLEIYHNSSGDSVIQNHVGDLYFTNKADNKDIVFRSDDGAGGFETYFYLDGSSTGTNNPMTVFPDNSKLGFGNATVPDLLIYHDSNNSYIVDNGTGDLAVITTRFYVKSTAGEAMFRATENGACDLFHNNIATLSTTSTGIDVSGEIKIDSALLSNQVNTDIDTGAEVVAQVAHATYTAAFFDFVVKKGTNVRSGTVYACHDGDTTPLVEFTETSTNDLGDTSDVTLSVDISGANMRLLATVTSDDWSVKSLIRAI